MPISVNGKLNCFILSTEYHCRLLVFNVFVCRFEHVILRLYYEMFPYFEIVFKLYDLVIYSAFCNFGSKC